ncbi:helix-turn-helix domain-containing protein [Lysobacter sp. D1-1-M9]|uniref:helix-turn-helix domain-containing protein n=1 Tax=Novilysobacter longmucuonensis TaxID=3098603 RepID=UPI002FC6FD13
MSYIRDVATDLPCATKLTRALGNALRTARQAEGLTQAQLAQRAGIARQKLIQLEQGKPGVAMAAYTAALDALGLQLALQPTQLRITDYPQLKRLAWNRPGDDLVTERDALALYERNWRLVDQEQMPARERELLQRLVQKHGGGILHV